MAEPGRVIALTGHARAGKNTVADIVAELKEPFAVCQLSFAGPMKEFAGSLFGFTKEQLYGKDRDKPDPRWTRPNGEPLTCRYALQTLGTEWGRSCDPNIWAKRLVREASAYLEGGFVVLVTDLRFVNEAALLLEIPGAEVWRVRRDSVKPEAGAVHASEQEIWSDEMDAFVDVDLDNNGTLDYLRAQVMQVL